MTEPIKLPPLPVILIHLGYGWMAEDYARLAVEQATAELRAEIERLRAALEYAVSQNEHDMLLTGDECRAARNALKEPK